MTASPIQVDTSLQDIIDAGYITVGIEVAYPPFELRDPITDEIIGFDPEIMQYIADDIGMDIVWVDVSWATIFTSLVSGMFDCVISAVTITAQREETMDFSRWYFKSEQAVMVAVDNPKNINTIDDINSTEVNVGVQEVTTSDLYLMDNNIIAVKSSFAAITLAIEALALGTVDVVLGDRDTLVAGMTSYPGEFEIVDTFSPKDFGIPVQTGFDSLRLRINSIIEELLGSDLENPVVSDYYNASYYKWMGVEPTFVSGTTDTIDDTDDSTDDTSDFKIIFTIPGFSLITLIAVTSIISAILARKVRK
ncbi:MAG: ABC transporter substrate-binding protein [Promethearchaeota archaeon]